MKQPIKKIQFSEFINFVSIYYQPKNRTEKFGEMFLETFYYHSIQDKRLKKANIIDSIDIILKDYVLIPKGANYGNYGNCSR